MQHHGVVELLGCSIPEFRDFDPVLLILEISYVSPPCVLDFGKSRLDDPGDFSQEVKDHWIAQIESNFGRHADWALQIFETLGRSYGVYHDDIRHENYMLSADEDEIA